MYKRQGEALADLGETDPGEDGDTVPLVEAVVGDLVATRLQPLHRELVGLGLGLLDRQDVDVRSGQPGLDAVDPAADGVDVPGCLLYTSRCV